MSLDDTPPDADRSVWSRGMRFPLDRTLLNRRTIRALKTEQYEAREAEAVSRVVKEYDTVLELGAGIGYMSTLAAGRCPGGQVHCFEANPGLIPYIQRVHAANGVKNVEIHNAILGPHEGTATFHVREDFLASSLDRLSGDGIVREETIAVRDARRETQRLKPTVLICDIEGAETQVIPALDLSSVRVAVVELHPQWIGAQGVAAVFQAMMAAGLVYYPRRSNAKVVCFRRDW